MVRLKTGAVWLCLVVTGFGLLLTPWRQPIPLYVICQLAILLGAILALRWSFLFLVVTGTGVVLAMSFHAGGFPYILYSLNLGVLVVGIVYGHRWGAVYAVLAVAAFLLSGGNPGNVFIAVAVAAGMLAGARWMHGVIVADEQVRRGIRLIVRAGDATFNRGALATGGAGLAGRSFATQQRNEGHRSESGCLE